jgi:Cu+-exporting ATPase
VTGAASFFRRNFIFLTGVPLFKHLNIFQKNQMTTKDIVCGMTVDESASQRADYDGKIYFFCSSGCKDKFLADPDRYLKKHDDESGHQHQAKTQMDSPDRQSRPESGGYTCPMHPEVVRNEPGACPKCGMALKPRKTAS